MTARLVAAATQSASAREATEQSHAAVHRLHQAAEAAAVEANASADHFLSIKVAEARALLDALEAELAEADKQAEADGVAPDTPVPLSQPPPAVARQQYAPQPQAAAPAAPADVPQQPQRQQEAVQTSAAALRKQPKPQPQLDAEPIIGDAMSDWAPPAAPLESDLPASGGEFRAEGSGHEILLQAFNWESCNAGDWWGQVERAAGDIAAAGFTLAWLPPPTNSVSRQGYLPRDLYDLNSAYGSEDGLKKCVRALQAAGVKVLADIVINHRCAHAQDSAGAWNVFGGKLAWDAHAVVGDDPAFRGRGANSSGDPFGAAPNVDHSAPFVKRDLSEWLRWLRNDTGFDGWRFDFVRGYSGEHVADYCEASSPEMVVGEYWDSLAYRHGVALRNQDAHRGRTVAWLKAASGAATAFDVTTKGILHQAFERGDLSRLKDREGKPPGLMGWWPSHATTFLENHDTGSTQGHWRFPAKRVEAGYAYLLTHPGTPSVFWDHWQDKKLRSPIERLVAIRRSCGIHCRSQVHIHRAEKENYVAEIDNKLLMKMGIAKWKPEGDEWQQLDSGDQWTIWERR